VLFSIDLYVDVDGPSASSFLLLFFFCENATNLVVLLTFKILKLEGFVVYSFCSFSNSPHPPTPQIYGSEACGNTSTMTENHNKALKMMATTLY
jgi:hypothetical protein